MLRHFDLVEVGYNAVVALAKAARGCADFPQSARAADQQALVRRDELFEFPSSC